jgi:hypothetical protein
MEDRGNQAYARTVLCLCAAAAAAGAVENVLRGPLASASSTAPNWICLAAAAVAAAGAWPAGDNRLPRVRRALQWAGFLLLVFVANGLPLDLLRLTRLIPLPIDWPGLATKALALSAAVVIGRRLLALPGPDAAVRTAAWYGYAAFLLALPYPVLRVCWAFGATPGLSRPGAGGAGFAPLLLTIPWLMAAVLSLLLVPIGDRFPRRLLLAGGWTATTIVGLIGPGACWTLVAKPAPVPADASIAGMATWVFAVVYGSWLLWGIAVCAATRSYQVRTANRRVPLGAATAGQPG